MPGLDISTWPTWIIAILLVINLFKEQIAAFIPTAISDHFRFRAERTADQEEHAQLLEEVLLNGKLQTEAAEQLRKSWREEQWVELLQFKDSWLHEFLDAKLDRLQESADRQTKELAGLRSDFAQFSTEQHQGFERLADILTTIHIALSRRPSDG